MTLLIAYLLFQLTPEQEPWWVYGLTVLLWLAHTAYHSREGWKPLLSFEFKSTTTGNQ